MKDDPHAHILDAYFWRFVDRGEAPIDTPLFTGTHEGSLLGHGGIARPTPQDGRGCCRGRQEWRSRYEGLTFIRR